MSENLLILLISGAGVLCLCLELFMPGLVLGIGGGAALLYALWKAYAAWGAWGAFWLAAGDIILVAVFFNLCVKFLPGTKLGKRFFLTAAVPDDEEKRKNLERLVGLDATVETVLRPTGMVRVDGLRHQARAESGAIEKDARVRIIGVEANNLIVKIPENLK